MISQYIFYFLLAYLTGGIMFGALIPKIFCGLDIRRISEDGNPGTANVFLYAGPFWGILVLVCDLVIAALILGSIWGVNYLIPQKGVRAQVMSGTAYGETAETDGSTGKKQSCS